MVKASSICMVGELLRHNLINIAKCVLPLESVLMHNCVLWLYIMMLICTVELQMTKIKEADKHGVTDKLTDVTNIEWLM